MLGIVGKDPPKAGIPYVGSAVAVRGRAGRERLRMANVMRDPESIERTHEELLVEGGAGACSTRRRTT